MTGRRFKFSLAYDGTRFVGWQRQKKGRTVQAVLEEALAELTGKRLQVTGAGRTDSGVHALGQVAHAEVTTRLSPREILRALNALLPEDVVVQSVQTVSGRFHARTSAKSKWYRYQIWNDPVRPLDGRERKHHVPHRLNLPAMRGAARKLSGRRDFKAFHSSGRPVRSTVRHLRSLTITREGKLIRINARADGFLYHMVRRIAGHLLEIGRGKPPPKIAPSAPAKGLCLISVRY